MPVIQPFALRRHFLADGIRLRSAPPRLDRLVTVCSLPLVFALSSAAQAQDQNHVVLGIGAAIAPAYQGAKSMRLLPIPSIDIKQGWFVANFRNGIGIAPINTDMFTVGASAVFVQGYRKKDVPQGIDRLSDGLGARVFLNVRARGLTTTIGLVKVVSGGTKGMFADASLSYPIRATSRMTLIPTLGTTWADRTYNDRYFGVTPAESLASGRAQFTGKAGFKDVTGLLTASYRLADRLTLSATGGVTALVGNVKNSPLVETKVRPSGIVALSYRFR